MHACVLVGAADEVLDARVPLIASVVVWCPPISKVTEPDVLVMVALLDPVMEAFVDNVDVNSIVEE